MSFIFCISKIFLYTQRKKTSKIKRQSDSYLSSYKNKVHSSTSKNADWVLTKYIFGGILCHFQEYIWSPIILKISKTSQNSNLFRKFKFSYISLISTDGLPKTSVSFVNLSPWCLRLAKVQSFKSSKKRYYYFTSI